MTRRGPSRRRFSGSLRRRQGSALRADPFGADGLDRASREPMTGSYVMAPLSDAVECDAGISIARYRELLGDEADSMTDHDIAEIRRHALAMAHIVVEMYEEHYRVQGVLNGRIRIVAPRERNRPDFPLRGLVRCHACGRGLTAGQSAGTETAVRSDVSRKLCPSRILDSSRTGWPFSHRGTR
jgi:hypothetical protein